MTMDVRATGQKTDVTAWQTGAWCPKSNPMILIVSQMRNQPVFVVVPFYPGTVVNVIMPNGTIVNW
ncbi:MAG: hypothetical protein DRN81_03000 [Thermoproteota archaeon]|nr:MAG: hypothetical protein DRN81_03000 [Candidatus Korarchaeota archaeon]